MEFRTKIQFSKSDISITHQDSILLLGSCFTENIGQLLQYYGFKALQNPHGILYNPISIFKSLEEIAQQKQYTMDDLIAHRQLYLSLQHHGKFSDYDANTVLSKINTAIHNAYTHWIGAEYIVFTIGTSFVYYHKERNTIAGNCHKIPATAFEKRLLSIEEIKQSYQSIQSILKDKKVLFTVSPVRHWRDGAIENQRSKSILIESTHQIIAENTNCFYFPSYEIMMDELRDYRFYAEDMLHPNEIAVKYIWQQFADVFFDDTTKKINDRIEKGRLLFNHRLKHTNTDENAAFETKKIQFKNAFKQDFPMIDIAF